MKIERITLCYSDMDRIIVNKQADLQKFDLSKVSAMIVESYMSVEEFNRMLVVGQSIQAGASTNIETEIAAENKPNWVG